MEPQHFSRRELLRQSAVGFGSLALASMLAEDSPASAEASEKVGLPHFTPRAKRIIFLFMKGGPSHLDTFDYKPKLQRDHGKDLPFPKPRVTFAKTNKLLKSPWRFRRYGQSGTLVSDLFSNVAEHVDDICFIKSLHGTNPAHGGAVLKVHTGSDNFVRPSMGSWITYGLGTQNQDLPGFITICPTLAHGGVNNWASAFLPATHQGVPLGVASQPAASAALKYVKNKRLSRDLQRAQLDLLQEVNRDYLEKVGPSSDLDARIRSFELAFRMQTEMPEIQDLSGETPATLKLYGLDNKVTEDFGRQCLMARRFAERGVRFVQVTHSDTKVQWDQHSALKRDHEEKAAEVDVPIAGLLTDLKARGLLKDTLVLWGGEFGRTPTAEGSDGRDHNPEGFTMWLAGGGVRGGMHYGSTDEYGYYAAEDKVHIHDLHATVLDLLGLDHEKLTYHYAGRDFRLTDVYGKVIRQIMA